MAQILRTRLAGSGNSDYLQAICFHSKYIVNPAIDFLYESRKFSEVDLKDLTTGILF
jgi:hypothetical protein